MKPTAEEIARRIISPWMADGVPLDRLPGGPQLIADIAAAIRAAEIAASGSRVGGELEDDAKTGAERP